MSRRIDIELTSALGDGTWTWRAAGAKQPKGVLDGSILSADAKVGDEIKVEVDQEMDGISVLSVVHGREKQARDGMLELIPDEKDFQPVVEHRAKRDRNERRGRGEGRGGGGGRGRRDGGRDGRRDGGRDGGRGGRDGDRDGGRGGRGGGRDGGRDGGRRGHHSFEAPPEVPQRPKPKRLRPGKTNRSAVLAELPEEQRPIAELTLQGMGAVRQRLKEENEKAVAEGRPAMPEASVIKMAEELLPRLRAAEWRDRAEAAQRQLDNLDLRDLRSVVAAAGDPVIARDESLATLAQELQEALARKQEEELLLWYGDVDAALAVGRVIRALRLSSQPPKAGVPFPVDIAQRLADSANAALAPMDAPDRWSAMLEAAAFSPIRSMIAPVRKPDAVNDELLATVKRLAPALPQVAALFEIEVDPKAAMPKPLRPGPRQRKAKDQAERGGRRGERGQRDGGGRDRSGGKRSDKPSSKPSDKQAVEGAATGADAATPDSTPKESIKSAGPPEKPSSKPSDKPAAKSAASDADSTTSDDPVESTVPADTPEASAAPDTPDAVAEDTPTDDAPTEAAAEDTSADEAPTEAAAEDTPTDEAPTEAAAEDTPPDEAPTAAEDTSADEAPTAAEDTPADEAPTEAEDTSADEAPTEAAADDTPDAVAEDTPTDDTGTGDDSTDEVAPEAEPTS